MGTGGSARNSIHHLNQQQLYKCSLASTPKYCVSELPQLLCEAWDFFGQYQSLSPALRPPAYIGPAKCVEVKNQKRDDFTVTILWPCTICRLIEPIGSIWQHQLQASSRLSSLILWPCKPPRIPTKADIVR